MKEKTIGIISFVCLVLTTLWLISFVIGAVSTGPLKTFDQVLIHINNLGALHYFLYANAALVTISAVVLITAFYLYYKTVAPVWSAIGGVFVPIYGTINLTVYLSQITVIPRIIELHGRSEYRAFVDFLFRQILHFWTDSAIFVINNLAYAVFGIPSIIFGLLMLKSRPAIKIGGSLLLLSGFAGIAGFIGIAAQSQWLGQGSLIGGVFYLLALVPMSWGFLTERNT